MGLICYNRKQSDNSSEDLIKKNKTDKIVDYEDS